MISSLMSQSRKLPSRLNGFEANRDKRAVYDITTLSAVDPEDGWTELVLAIGNTSLQFRS